MVKLPDVVGKVVKWENLRVNSTRIPVGFYTARVTPHFDPRRTCFLEPSRSGGVRYPLNREARQLLYHFSGTEKQREKNIHQSS